MVLWITVSLGRSRMAYRVKLDFPLTYTSPIYQLETEIVVVINNIGFSVCSDYTSVTMAQKYIKIN